MALGEEPDLLTNIAFGRKHNGYKFLMSSLVAASLMYAMNQVQSEVGSMITVLFLAWTLGLVVGPNFISVLEDIGIVSKSNLFIGEKKK